MQKNVEKMTFNYSPNFNPKKREKNKIKYLIYHYTGMKNDKLAIKRLTSFNSNVSCHYYITKSGKLIQMVPDLYIAWHAGKSNWKNFKSLNISIPNSFPSLYCSRSCTLNSFKIFLVRRYRGGLAEELRSAFFCNELVSDAMNHKGSADYYYY